MLTRRQFLIAAAATSSAAAIGYIPFAQSQKLWLVSACSNKNNEHFVAAFDLNGNIINQVKLPARGHDVIAVPNKPGYALVFARRPGTFILEVDFVNGRITKQITAAEHSHFYGHGVLSAKDNILLTSENDFSTGHGKIVVRDAQNYQILEQYDSGGIGPHQLGLMPDGNSLVVANGGIQTHPDQPRKKLNIDTMAPNLVYLNIASGQIEGKFSLANHKLSIRHLAVSKQGKVIAGLQYQGAKTDLVPLAISHHGENSLTYLSASEHIWRRMNHYTASVCIDDVLDIAAISCPRADLITYWSLKNNEYLSSEKFADGAGLTHINKIYATSGKGRLIESKITSSSSNNDSLESFSFPGLKWDNHLSHIVV
jgi:hypothetical protein